MMGGLFLLFAASLAQAQAGSVLIDSGKIRFYETKQIRGEETYQINQSPNGDLIVQARTDLPFAEQENKPLVNATLRTAKDLTPQSFEIKGPTLLDLEEATSTPFKVRRQPFRTAARTDQSKCRAASSR